MIKKQDKKLHLEQRQKLLLQKMELLNQQYAKIAELEQVIDTMLTGGASV